MSGRWLHVSEDTHLIEINTGAITVATFMLPYLSDKAFYKFLVLILLHWIFLCGLTVLLLFVISIHTPFLLRQHYSKCYSILKCSYEKKPIYFFSREISHLRFNKKPYLLHKQIHFSTSSIVSTFQCLSHYRITLLEISRRFTRNNPL